MSKMVIIMSGLRSLFLMFLAAGMLTLGIPNEFFHLGSTLFGIFSILPLYLAIRECSSNRSAGFLTGGFFFLVHVMSSFWLAYFKDFAVFTLGASAFAYFLLGIPVGWALRHCFRFPPAWRPFLFAAVWTVWEWVKSIGFLAYPWGTLVMTSRDFVPLIQIADLTGTWGIGFLFCLFSSCGAELLASRDRRECIPALIMTFVLFLSAVGYGCIRMVNLPEAHDEVDMVLVQNNADPWERGGLRKNLLRSQKMTRDRIPDRENPPDLVVWSESILTHSYRENRAYYDTVPLEDPFTGFLSDINAPLLVGSPVLVDSAERRYSNSVILLDSDGSLRDWYAKIQLVCFGGWPQIAGLQFLVLYNRARSDES